MPGYIEALHVAARTDLVAFVPRRLIAALAKQLSLNTVTPPLDPGIDEQHMFYPTPRPVRPGIDLAAEADAADRTGTRTFQTQGRLRMPVRWLPAPAPHVMTSFS